MAQAGYTPILLFASGTPGSTPSAGNLTSSASGAELAINYADGKLFYKDSGGSVQVIATKGAGTIGGSNTQVQYNSSGALAGSANLTFDGTTLTAAGLKNSALTSGRLVYSTTGGAQTDSANLTFNGTTLTAGGFTTTGATATGTLTASSTVTFNSGNLGVTAAGGSVSSAVFPLRISWADSAGTNFCGLQIYNTGAADYRAFYGADNSGAARLGDNGGGGIKFYSGGVAGTNIGTWTTTGLAVTGTLSATGATTLTNLTAAASGQTTILKDTAAYSAGSSGPLFLLQGLDSTSANNNLAAFVANPTASQNSQLLVKILNSGSATTVGTFSTTGLAVTGALSATGNVTVGSGGTSPAASITINGGSNSTTGSYLRLQVAGSTVGGIYSSGAIKGDTTTNLALFAETGKTVDVYANGAAVTPIGSFSSTGLAVTGIITGSSQILSNANASGFNWKYTGGSDMWYNNGNGAGTAASNTVSVFWIRADSVTSRSINAGGTINASGADYAEYETKASDCGEVAKGQIVGFDADGNLTDKWSEAHSFGIKSTNPSYVGGDVWGTEDALGIQKPTKPADDATEEALAQYEQDKAAFEAALEAARQRVDRVAYSGKVPVNVTGASIGDYIVAVQDGDGIGAQIIPDPDFSQYKAAVGRVRRILEDGRAVVAVVVH